MRIVGRRVCDIVVENVFTVFNITLFLTLAATLALGPANPATRRTVLGDTLFAGASVWLNSAYETLRPPRRSVAACRRPRESQLPLG
jgi:hypothetical protein